MTTIMLKSRSLPLLMSALLAACGPAAQEDAKPAAAPAGVIALTAEQKQKLAITLASAQAAGELPFGTVPALVSLPPEARVAVTSPYGGTVTRIFVIEGQQVRAGQPLATVQASDSIQYSAALARARAELPVAEAQAKRLEQLAREGIIAPARADEARAAAAAARASVSENARLLGIAHAGGNGTITLVAPISGRVAHVGIETGASLTNAEAPFIVENVSALRLDLQIPERLAGQVTQGMAVTVEQDGKLAHGRVLSVGQSLDPATRSITARAALDAGATLVPGKAVMAVLAGSQKGSGVAVPETAVARMEDADYVFVAAPQGFRRAQVTVAGHSGGKAFLSAGLKAGEQVAATSVAELKALAGQ